MNSQQDKLLELNVFFPVYTLLYIFKVGIHINNQI